MFVGGQPAACSGFSFCDEFSGSSLDTAKWTAVSSHMEAPAPGCFDPAQVTEGGGFVTETVENRTFTCPDGTGSNSYPSGAIQFKSFSFTYGTVEIRARVAGCTGCWPAIWLLGSNCQNGSGSGYLVQGADPPGCNWATFGSEEIDEAEFFSDSGFTSIHNAGITGASGSCTTAAFGTSAIPDASANFNTYKLVWAPGSLTFYVNGTQVNHITSCVSSSPSFLIVNTTIGANGGTINNATLPKTTQVDWVHVTS